MEAKDLRIGNKVKQFIYDFYEDKRYKTEQFEYTEVDLIILEVIQKGEFESELFEPILLTKDFFKEIKLSKHNVSDYKLCEEFYLTEANHLNSNEWYLYKYGGYDEDVLIGEPIKYLHELQNIVYLLKKVELEINL